LGTEIQHPNNDKKLKTKPKVIVIAGDKIENQPNDKQIDCVVNQAETVISQALEILEKGGCYSSLKDDVNENKDAFDQWIEKTKESHRKIGLLLKKHPQIYFLSVVVRNHPLKEMPRYIPKNYNQFNLMWGVSQEKNKCLVIAFRKDDLASFYGLAGVPTKEKMLYVYIQNIPKSYPYVVKGVDYPNFTDQGIRIEPNKASLLETIISTFHRVEIRGEGSKGFLISVVKKVDRKSRNYWADAIRVYSTYNYDNSLDESREPECPKTFYGKEYCLCATIPLAEE
jgi:hypothetical protein